MKLYVKYMVSLRCKLIVKELLEKLGLHPAAIELGQIETVPCDAFERASQD